jgi:hypothetical protein
MPYLNEGSGASPDRPPRCRQDAAQRRAKARLFQAVEAAFDIGHDDLCAATRGRCGAARARQTGMYLARVALGMTLSQAGNLFGRDRTTAAHACRVVEDARDDRAFDALLVGMERFVLGPMARDAGVRP